MLKIKTERICMECKEKYEDNRLDMPYCESCFIKLSEEQESQVIDQEYQELAERVKDHPKFCDCFICVHV